MSDNITIVRSHNRRLAKVIRADGSIGQYDRVKTIDLIEHQIADLVALEILLRDLEPQHDRGIIRGKPADPHHVLGVRRLLYVDRETGELPTLTEVPRRWLALDIDDLARPDWVDPEDLPACACIAIRTLPGEFQRATFIVQATASHGLKPGIRIRLWAWLTRPITGGELKYWLRRAPVDRSIFGPAQIIYTAAPVILRGAFDPLPARLAVIPGRGEVPVPHRSRLRPPARAPSPRAEPDRSIDPLVRYIETAKERNNALFWAACRLAEQGSGDAAAKRLLDAAIRAGLSAKEATATLKSGLRHG